MAKWMWVGIVGVALALPARAAAQVDNASPGATVAEVEQAFDRYFLNQARLALQLSPSQMASFRPKLEQLRRVRRQTQRQRQGLLSELQALTRGGGPVDEETLSAKMKALDDQKVEAEQRIRDAYDQIDATLSVPQRARFRFLEERMERQQLDLIARARAQARRGAPPGE